MDVLLQWRISQGNNSALSYQQRWSLKDSVGADMALKLLSGAAVTRRALARVGGGELVSGVWGVSLAGADEVRAGPTRR